MSNREVQPIHPDSIMVAWAGTSFNRPFRQVTVTLHQTDGSSMRMHMDVTSARNLAATILDTIDRLYGTLSQWERSSDMPSDEVSVSMPSTSGQGQ